MFEMIIPPSAACVPELAAAWTDLAVAAAGFLPIQPCMIHCNSFQLVREVLALLRQQATYVKGVFTSCLKYRGVFYKTKHTYNWFEANRSMGYQVNLLACAPT